MITNRQKGFLEKAIELSRSGLEKGHGGPFGCVIVKGDRIISEGYNRVLQTNDPTAHAEIVAIREACIKLGTFLLTDCEVYASCEPCPMCLGAIYWSRPKLVVFANTRKEAASIEFDDEFIYHEINAELDERKIPFVHYPHPEAKAVFEAWRLNPDKQHY